MRDVGVVRVGACEGVHCQTGQRHLHCARNRGCSAGTIEWRRAAMVKTHPFLVSGEAALLPTPFQLRFVRGEECGNRSTPPPPPPS